MSTEQRWYYTDSCSYLECEASHDDLDKDSSFMKCCVISLGDDLPTFLRIVVVLRRQDGAVQQNVKLEVEITNNMH
jgi:hypothetical protein